MSSAADRVRAVLMAIAAPLAGGCIQGSLATDTGPSASGLVSVADVQKVHAGETVHFSFVLREPWQDERLVLPDIADYAVFDILGERYEVEAAADRFEHDHAFTGLSPGQTVEISAEAYKTHGRRDYMKIRGRWMRSQSPNEKADERVAADRVQLDIYQSELEYTFDAPPDLNWSSARLILQRRDGEAFTILPREAQSGGFSHRGPDEHGRCTVTYQPAAGQVNKTGTTAAALQVDDASGVTHEFRFQFETP